MWRHRFFQLCALVLIKNYQLIANPHVWAAQSWHLRGIAQAVDESGALCSNRTGVRPRLEYELATTPTTGATRMCLGVVFTSNQQSDAIYLPEDDRRKRRMVRLPNGDFTTGLPEFSGWYSSSGINNVAAYLATLDISGCDPEAPPPKGPGILGCSTQPTTARNSQIPSTSSNTRRQSQR
jgi:hypothetical protein